MSDIQDYIEYIIKKHETLTAIPPVHIYTNRVVNRLVFKVKDRYKLELQTPETTKLFGPKISPKKLIDKRKNEENLPGLEEDVRVLVQCNLVDNQYQQKSKTLYIFTSNFYK